MERTPKVTSSKLSPHNLNLAPKEVGKILNLRYALTKGWRLEHQLRNYLRWLIHIINSVDEIKLFCYTHTHEVPQFFLETYLVTRVTLPRPRSQDSVSCS